MNQIKSNQFIHHHSKHIDNK